MRVLFITPRYYPFVGGVEFVVKSIAERIKESIVLCGDPSIKKVKEEKINGVQVFRWPTYAPSNAYHFPKRRNQLTDFLKGLLKDVDLVHVHNAHAFFSVYSGLKVKKINKNIRIIFTLHHIGLNRSFINGILWKFWKIYVSKLIKNSDKVQALSNIEMKWIISKYPVVKEKITLIPNGVEEDVFMYRWNGSEDYVVFCGRIEKYKRVDLVIKIAEKLNLKALIVGEGSYKKVLMKKAKNTEFLPPQPREKYLELLANAKFAANPSKNEALSMFVLENLAIGTPTFVSDVILESIKGFVHNIEDTRFDGDVLYLVREGHVLSWDEVVEKIIRDLYLA